MLDMNPVTATTCIQLNPRKSLALGYALYGQQAGTDMARLRQQWMPTSARGCMLTLLSGSLTAARLWHMPLLMLPSSLQTLL